MLFNSYEFLLFLPLVLLLYWSLSRWLWAQNVLLVVASYLFYAWWDVRFLGLIVSLTLAGYLAGIGIERVGNQSRAAHTICTTCILVCVGVLGMFKYYNFFVESFNTLLLYWQTAPCLPLWQVVLPVGISFYTFQILSYAIDVKRGILSPCHNPINFAAFVCFFPQLVAGPIERATNLLPQMQHKRSVSYTDVTDGLRLMLWGFVKKMLLADRCAPIVNAIYANPQADGTDLWMGAILFAFQIYGDFSGYSDIAIGTSRLFGIRLMQNFNVPYFSRNVAEFWRRWHISLMSWFKDYVYIPLGGSRCSMPRRMVNTAIVFLVSGLWHGANWTFVVWGTFQWVGFVPLLLFQRWFPKPQPAIAPGRLLPGLHEAAQILSTFLFICIGWVFFRSEQISHAFERIERMFTHISMHTPYGGMSSLIPIIFVTSVEWVMRNRRHGLDIAGNSLMAYRPIRWMVYYALIFSTLYWGGQQTAFIYFQF